MRIHLQILRTDELRNHTPAHPPGVEGVTDTTFTGLVSCFLSPYHNSSPVHVSFYYQIPCFTVPVSKNPPVFYLDTVKMIPYFLKYLLFVKSGYIHMFKYLINHICPHLYIPDKISEN